MYKYLPIVLFNFCFSVSAQSKLKFNYDAAGNQTLRELCLSGCGLTAKQVKEIKEIEALTDDDLLKFSPEDVISYYPNPVREELFLQWELTDNRYVSSIHIYATTGQLLRSFQLTQSTNNLNIAFQNYAVGMYLVMLSYNDGGEKSIKIIKQ